MKVQIVWSPGRELQGWLATVHSRGLNAVLVPGVWCAPGLWDDGCFGLMGGNTRSRGLSVSTRWQGGGVSLRAFVVPTVERWVGGIVGGLLLGQRPARVQWPSSEQHDVPHDAAERSADEAVKEKVDSRVEHGQHIGQVVGQVDTPILVNRGNIEVVDDYNSPRSPQNWEHGGERQQHGRGFS